MMRTIISLALLSVVLEGCFTKKNVSAKTTGTPAQKIYVDIHAENLSENGTKVSTQNDEIVFLIYLVSPDTATTPDLLLSEYAVFDSLHSTYSFEPELKPSVAGELYFVLVEIDSDKNKEQVEPVVRLNLRAITAAYTHREPEKWITYLGDDDLLGIQTMKVEDLSDRKEEELTMEGMKLLDAYKCTVCTSGAEGLFVISICRNLFFNLQPVLPVIYTIGHSTHPADYFLELLFSQGVNCLVDVRSMPASRFNPQFNKKALQAFLEKYGIVYLHFGEEFGARKSDPALLDEAGHLDFEKVRASAAFRSGVERLRKGVEKGFTIALMCAEADPLSCHRFSMISVALKKEFDVRHILKDKTVLTQEEVEAGLVKKYAKKLKKQQAPASDQLKLAFRLNNLDVAYAPGDERLKK